MKTTLHLDDSLLLETKARAAQQHTSLTRHIEEGLQLRLQAEVSLDRSEVRLPVYAGSGGLAQGLDGRNNKAMQEAAEAG